MQVILKFVILGVLIMVAFKLLMFLIPALVGLLAMILPWAALGLVGFFLFKTFQKYQEGKKYGRKPKLDLSFGKKTSKTRTKTKDKNPW